MIAIKLGRFNTIELKLIVHFYKMNLNYLIVTKLFALLLGKNYF